MFSQQKFLNTLVKHSKMKKIQLKLMHNPNNIKNYIARSIYWIKQRIQEDFLTKDNKEVLLILLSNT